MVMAKLLEIHPQNPQNRLIKQVVDELNAGSVIAYPTDSGYV
jgi:tRNA A37 threonylcarbamoyladenosine synthetase subunit TsaC/SUA5/YrdC